MRTDSSTDLTGITMDAIEASYWIRGLDVVPDAQLVAAAADALAVPRHDPASSFVLHAPLELAARAALLPLVDPAQRDAARIRIVSLVAGYQEVEPATEAPVAPEGSADPVDLLLAGVAAGDLRVVDGAARAVASSLGRHDLVARLGPAVLSSTAAAGHAPIFLHHLERRDPLCGLRVDLLRPLARELARHPDWRVSWTDRWSPQGPTDAAALGKALATFPGMGVPGSSFIHPLLMQVDREGVADAVLGPVLGERTPEAGREVLRVAARSMLHDTPDHAPYGWSHCLTIPQALLSVSAGTRRADVGLALAATSVASFRAAHGEVEVPMGDVDLPEVDEGRLATDATLSHDAHVVKYVLACLDAAHEDPEAAPLFRAAGRRLLDVWEANGGDPSDPLG